MTNIQRAIKFTSLFSSTVCFCLTGVAHAQATETKSQYSLFNPTPREQMRELSTDRPDKTESPYSVDAGHFQIETDLVIVRLDESKEYGIETQQTSTRYLQNNIKVGLNNWIDLQAIFATHQHDEIKVSGEPLIRRRGFGDTVVRLKMNILGNDSGEFAAALMPFARIPTNTGNLNNKRVDWGLIVPAFVVLPEDWNLGFMYQFNKVMGQDGGTHSEYISTVALGHSLYGNLSGYVEIYSQSSEEVGSPWVATLDGGLTYELNPNLQLDLGLNWGITEAAPDFEPFLGVSARL